MLVVKTCKTCGEEKPLSEFYVNKRMRDGYVNVCKACSSAYSSQHYQQNKDRRNQLAVQWQVDNRDKVRGYARDRRTRQKAADLDGYKERDKHYKLRGTYGIGLEDYTAMLQGQGGGCAICGSQCQTGKRLAVDHDHQSGAIRGLLCHSCNTSLGHFKDDPSLLRIAANYLERPRGPETT